MTYASYLDLPLPLFLNVSFNVWFLYVQLFCPRLCSFTSQSSWKALCAPLQWHLSDQSASQRTQALQDPTNAGLKLHLGTPIYHDKHSLYLCCESTIEAGMLVLEHKALWSKDLDECVRLGSERLTVSALVSLAAGTVHASLHSTEVSHVSLSQLPIVPVHSHCNHSPTETSNSTEAGLLKPRTHTTEPSQGGTKTLRVVPQWEAIYRNTSLNKNCSRATGQNSWNNWIV